MPGLYLQCDGCGARLGSEQATDPRTDYGLTRGANLLDFARLQGWAVSARQLSRYSDHLPDFCPACTQLAIRAAPDPNQSRSDAATP